MSSLLRFIGVLLTLSHVSDFQPTLATEVFSEPVVSHHLQWSADEQLDFPIIYCSALNGIAGMDPEALADNMDPMFQAIVDIVEPPKVEVDGPFQMQISALDYNSYVGVIGLGRIKRGSVKPNQQISVISVDGTTRKGKIGQVMTHMGLERVQTNEATAGDIVCITGIEDLSISDTLCDPSAVEALPPLSGLKNTQR